MFNTLCLVAALMVGTADAHKKHQKPHAHRGNPHHAHSHRVQPPRYVTPHVPHRLLVWTWMPGFYDAHGHWIRGYWKLTYRIR
jgi:hypothetical protein